MVRAPCSRALCLLFLVWATTIRCQGAERKCLGVRDGVCGPECQVHLCNSLSAFYKATLNATDPWDREDGWELTSRFSCDELVAQSPNEAAYCNWFGITCCHPEAVQAGNCTAIDTIYSIRMPINNLNASVGNPKLVQPLQQIHDCGLKILDLEANNLVGQMSELWGGLNQLWLLNFGNCWIEGRIPDSLRHLRNLTFINLSNNWLNGSLPAWIDELEALQVLNLGSQFGENADSDQVGLMGTIPVQIGKLRRLRELNLEANALTGSLPPNLCSGDDSNLLVLNLRANQLEGDATIVQSCGSLIELDISDNSFSGPLPASVDWDELASYRACHNEFTGTLPLALTEHARILEYLDISYNLLTGKFPNQVTLLSALKSLDISGNKFTGTLTEDVYYLPALTSIALSNNQFVGTIPPAIGLAYSLQIADFSNNPGMTGFIPPQLALVKGLQIIRIENTSLSCSGIIQPYTISTNASCSDPNRCKTPRMFGNFSTRYHICPQDQQLPCFLKFSDYLVPRDDKSNMRCRVIMRMRHEEAVQSCSGQNPYVQLSDQASLIPENSAFRYEQSWYVDPAYYQYQACECLVGYSAIWDVTHTNLTCVPADDPGFAAYKRTAVIVSSVAAAAILLAAVVVWRHYLSSRPQWLRERIMQQKRIKGAPKCLKPGDKVNVSIVVTDVKDFSELTRRCPELMNKAMGGHNNILRKACQAHAGYVMDQEGDSWTVAFHDAEDAVGFSLQVQQALAHKVWSMRIGASDAALQELRNMGRDEGFSHKYSMMMVSQTSAQPALPGSHSRESSCNAAAEQGTQAASLQQVILHGEAGPHDIKGARGGSSFTSSIWQGQASSNSSLSDLNQLAHVNGTSHEGSHRKSSTVLERIFSSKPVQAPGKADLSNGELQTSFSDTRSVKDSDTPKHAQHDGTAVQPQHSGGSWDSTVQVQGPLPSKSSAASGLHHGDASSTISSILHRPGDDRHSSTNGSRFWSAANIARRISAFGKSGPSYGKSSVFGADQQPMQLLKLAIRIGIATGPLPYGCDVSNCAVKDRAKECISDVANAGQVLIDEQTFLQIKDSLSVLGTLNESGYDDRMLNKLMHAQLVDKLQHQIACGRCVKIPRELSFSSDAGGQDAQDYDNDALVVHMGSFEVPALSLPDDSPTGKSPAAQRGSIELVIESGRSRSITKLEKDADRQAVAAAASVEPLQLYSVAAPGMRKPPENTQDLVHYKGWCEPVNMKTGWVKVQKGYFDAPAARHMHLLPSQVSYTDSHSPLPEVTIVFASVVGAASYAQKRSRTDMKLLNKAIRRCMLQQLAAVPGGDGYLCRCQEADMRYMIAFEQRHKAMQWCLAVQEALMYVNWPAHVLAHPGFEEVLDPATGLPLFRGPRLRMGLAEGQPNSVLPDHTGRANYYGGSVNRAARFTDVAAHGGQVVTDLALLQKVCRVWAAEAGEQADMPADTAEGLVVSASVPAHVTLQQPAAQPEQLKQQTVSGSLPVVNYIGKDHELLPGWGSSCSVHQPAPSAAVFISKDVDSEPAGMLEPAVRCSSETLQHLGRRTRDQHVTFSFNFGTRSAQQQQLIGDMHGLGVSAAALVGLPESAGVEQVFATHLGCFSFKGSGQSDMVSVLHSSIATRSFPSEPPKGKGERLSLRSGPVDGLGAVWLKVPASLLAARRAFRSLEGSSTARGSSS